MNSLRLSRLVLFVFGLFGLFGLFNFTPALRAQQIAPARGPQTQSSQNTLHRASSKRSPIFFVENVGQFPDARIQFQAQIGSSILTVRNKSLTLSVLEPLPRSKRKPNAAPPARKGVHLNLKFVGANKKIKIVPFRRIDTRMSFYLGDNPDAWRADVPVWEGVRLKNIYPKIDLVLTSKDGRFTPRLVAHKGADVSQVKLRIRGAQELKLAKNGVQVKSAVRAFTLPFFRIVNKANSNMELPDARVDGDVVTAPFTTKAASKESNTELDDDTIYQTLFGGGVLDFGSDIAVDSGGNAYVAGSRYSADYDSNAFVVKLDAAGTVIQTTIFGGSESDDASGIVVDAEGNAFVSGSTFSSDFAGGGNPYDYDGFVVKVNASGGLDWAQRLGGTDLDFANGLDWNGASLLVGGSSSSANWGAVSEGSGYLVEVDENGGVGAPEFLNLGAEGTYVSGVAVQGGAVWVTGASSSDGNAQGFVQNRSSGQTQTFGGSGNESPADIAVDEAGNAYVVGATDSTDWAGYHAGDCIGPEIARESAEPCHDVFVARWGADDSLTTQLFGGSGDDWGNGIAVNGQGEVFVVGDNGSGDWLTPYYGDGDGFVLQLNSMLTPTWTRVIGGSSFDGAGGVTVDASGAVYVAGNQSDGNDVNAYAMKLMPNLTIPTPTPTLTPTATPTPNVPLVTLEVFDSEGNAVSDLDLEDGWYKPNPLSVVVQVRNNTNTFVNWRADVRFGSPSSTTRFYRIEQLFECPGVTTPYNNEQFSAVAYDVICDILLEPQQSATLNWSLWIQPSTEGQLDLSATILEDQSQLAQAQRTILLPTAEIHPVALVAGLFASVPGPIKNYYSPLRDTLLMMGYEDDITLFTSAQDWLRVSHTEMATGLRANLQQWQAIASSVPYVKHDPVTFDFIGHSQGALIIRAYLERTNDADYIPARRVILVGGPNKGVLRAYTAREGLDAPLFPPDLISVFMWLLPEWAARCGHGVLVPNPVGGPPIPIVTDRQKYDALHDPNCHLVMPSEMLPVPDTSAGDAPYLEDINGTAYPYGRLRNPLLESRPNNAAEDPWFDIFNTNYYELNAQSNVDRMCQRLGGDCSRLFLLYNSSVNTEGKLIVSSNASEAPIWTNGKRERSEPTSGDNTVPEYSAFARNLWPGAEERNLANPSKKHLNLAVYPESQLTIVESLTGKSPPLTSPLTPLNNFLECFTPTCANQNTPQNQGVTEAQSDSLTQLIIVAENPSSLTGGPSPIDLLLTAPSGAKLGYDSSSQQIVGEIPLGLYAHGTQSAAEVLIYNPEVGEHSIRIVGTGTGSYRLFGVFFDGISAIQVIAGEGTIQEGETRSLTFTAPIQSAEVPYPPTVSAGVNLSAQTGQNVTFAGSFEDINPNDTHTIVWNFGDGTTVTGTLTPSHAFSASGVFPVTLNVTDSYGFSVNDTFTVTVSSPPTATPTASETPTPLPTTTPSPTPTQSGTGLTNLGPAEIWIGLKNSDDVGIKFDLRAEVYRNGAELVGSGELASVPGGSSGFNNAHLRAIPLTTVSGISFFPNDNLSLKVLVRNACAGSGKNSGTARLWFADSSANSHFDAIIGSSTASYYLVDSFGLITVPGSGPRTKIDQAAGAKCSPYKSFGMWNYTLP